MYTARPMVKWAAEGVRDWLNNHWLLHYRRSWLAGDVVAGLSVAMMLIPQAMSYAMLAGLPPHIGLYASILPLLLYALVGSSRELAVGPTAMQALLVASGVGALAAGDSTQYLALAVMLALLVGLMEIAMGLLRLGYLANFLSQPVISGFTSAAALVIGFSQLQHLLGLDLPRTENILHIGWSAVMQWSAIQPVTLVVGIGSLGLLVLLRRLQPLLPGALITVVLATLLTWWLDLHDSHALAVVGEVPGGLPPFGLSTDLPWLAMADLLPVAATIALIGLVESMAIARKTAADKGYDISPDRELVALGVANLGAALSKSMPVTGSFSRTAVNTRSGARSGLAGLVTAGVVALSLLLAADLFYFIPTATLAAVIIAALGSLVDVRMVFRLWRIKRDDLLMLLIAFGATLVLGVKYGVFVAAGISLVWFVMRTTRPHYALLGRLPGTQVYRNLSRFPEAERIPGVLCIRIDAQFYFGNVDYLKRLLCHPEQLQAEPVHTVILDASAINQIDSSAEGALRDIVATLREKGIRFCMASVKGPVRDVLQRSGLAEVLGQDCLYLTLHEAVSAADQAPE